MVHNSLTANAGGGSASVASRAGTRRRREFDRARAVKGVAEREPRRRCGTSPNSRLNRRQPTCPASSHSQVRERTMSEPVYVGIDVSKDTFHVATRPAAVKACLPNTPQGHRQL